MSAVVERDSMKSLIGQILKDIEENKAGRIRRTPGHWELRPDEEREPGNYPVPGKEHAVGALERFDHIKTDRQGRKMQLIVKRAVFCPNPDYADRFAEIQSEGRPLCLSVPESFCRECRFCRSGRASGHRYATCGFVAVENPKLETIRTFVGVLADAQKKVDELLSGTGEPDDNSAS